MFISFSLVKSVKEYIFYIWLWYLSILLLTRQRIYSYRWYCKLLNDVKYALLVQANNSNHNDSGSADCSHDPRPLLGHVFNSPLHLPDHSWSLHAATAHGVCCSCCCAFCCPGYSAALRYSAAPRCHSELNSTTSPASSCGLCFFNPYGGVLILYFVDWLLSGSEYMETEPAIKSTSILISWYCAIFFKYLKSIYSILMLIWLNHKCLQIPTSVSTLQYQGCHILGRTLGALIKAGTIGTLWWHTRSAGNENGGASGWFSVSILLMLLNIWFK